MSNRIEKVNSLLKHQIGDMLLKDFGFSGALVTLTRVDTTPNLIEAKIYVSVMPADKTDQVVRALNNQVYDIQQKINKKLNMRPIPRIRFVKDESLVSAANIERLIEKTKQKEGD